MKGHAADYGYIKADTTERDELEAFGIESGDRATGRYIDIRRREFFDEYYAYLIENGVSPYLI